MREAVGVIDIGQEVALDVKHSLQIRQLCKALSRQIQLTDDQGCADCLLIKNRVGYWPIFMNHQFTQLTQCRQILSIENITDCTRRRGQKDTSGF
ncbi:hypothetical protein D3C84_820910 [compost metagenome]